MVAYSLYAAAAAYLGILTAISPCPLATNIAAISYVGRKVGSPRAVMTAGLLYTLGPLPALCWPGRAVGRDGLVQRRRLAVSAKLHAPGTGPNLLAPRNVPGRANHIEHGWGRDDGGNEEADRRPGHLGCTCVGCALRGGLLPVLRHALLRTDRADPRRRIRRDHRQLANIGLVLPRASLAGSTIVLPCLYGIATALPVILVAFLLAYSAKSIGKAYNVISKVEWWARQITGWVFVLGGVYFSLKYVFDLG